MSQFKYEKLIKETAQAFQCFIEEYKRDRLRFGNNQIGELTEDKVKLITTYALFYLKNLKKEDDGKLNVRYNNTWKEITEVQLKGEKGDKGASNYEIWKSQGFNGTIADYFNYLKGEKGDRGEQGIQGIQGIQGATGLQGEGGERGLTGERGLKGDKGEPGRDVDPATINRINTELSGKVDKVNVKQLSTNDFTNDLKSKLEGIDLSLKLDKGGYIGTAKDLADKLENILTLLNSNNVNLDTLQEIVDFITMNRTKLEQLGISNIAGLVQALNNKADLNHNHDDRYLPKTYKPTWLEVQNKPDNLANTGQINDLQRKINDINTVLSQKASTNHTHNWNDIQSKPTIVKTGNKYTIAGIGGSIDIPEGIQLPSWIGQTKPSYTFSEILNTPIYFDANKLKYERISNVNDLLTENGVLKVADGNNLVSSPLQHSNNWWHILAGSHTNTKDYAYYLAFPLERDSNEFWYKQKINGNITSWKKFIGFTSLNNNGLFREWNLPHGLSTYIGDSDAYAVRTKFSGQGGDLLFSLNNEKAYFSRYLDTPEIRINTEGSLNATRIRTSGEDLIIGNLAWNDLRYLKTKGIKIWGYEDNNKVVLAGGGVTNLSELKNENVKVGGRNLVLNSKVNVTNSSYDILSFLLSEEPKVGEELTVTIKGVLGAGKIVFALYNRNGMQELCVLQNKGNGIFQSTFNWRSDPVNPKLVVIYVYDVSVTVNSTVEWIKIERGSVNRVDWSPAPEDIENKIDTIIKAGDVAGSNDWSYNLDYLGGTIVIETTCVVRLDKVPSGYSGSILKSGDNNNITFSCDGKQIVYTGDNTINGKDGSTATFTIYKNKCYIRISNV